jgi:hypothetical protein
MANFSDPSFSYLQESGTFKTLSLTVTSAVILVFVPILSGFVYHDNFVSDMRRTLVTFDTSSFIYILAHCL